VLSVGSLYGHGFDDAQRGALQNAGFSLRPQASTYAGSQLCHFIDFPIGPALEVIEVTDRSDYASFVPAGMTPYCPGISLVVAGGSPAELDRYERDLASYEPYRLQVPYQEGAGPGAPGWHYLNFARPLLPGTFIWLTAFDQPKPASARATRHATGVHRVVGLLFDLPPRNLDSLSELAGTSMTDGVLRIGDLTLAATGHASPPGRFPLRAVVLQAGDLDTARAHAPNARETHVAGRPALQIDTNPLAWDLLITT
jgi:hypothetical protein